MGKRSTFERRKNDAYPTWDKRAVPPLLPHLNGLTRFVEPCAGDGALIDNLESFGLQCVAAYDIEPRRFDIEVADARTVVLPPGTDQVISNTPWTRELLHAIIRNLGAQVPTWLLFDAGWAFTKQAGPLLRLCHLIVSVGRLRWVPDTPHDAQDDVAWYLFGPNAPAYPQFVGRA